MRPYRLTKPEYLDFTSGRENGHAQLRSLYRCLRERALPLHSPHVRELLAAVLRQVGPLAARGGGELSPTWAAELLASPSASDGCALGTVLCAELTSILDEIRGSPARVDGLAFVADASALLCGLAEGWGGPALPRLRRGAASVARAWAADLEAQALAQADDAAAVARLRARQATVCMYGVLGFAGTDALSREERCELAALLLASHAGRVFAADSAQPGPEGFEGLRARVRACMAQRAAALADAAASDPAMLDGAVRQLLPQHVPREGAPPLAWAPAAGVPPSAACFEAVTAARNLLSVNLLTGALLLDGSPPGSLPPDVLQHPLYVRLFGARDFEVSRTSSGALLTNRPLSGRFFYEFVAHGDGALDVTEIDASQGRGAPVRLELLPASDEGVAPGWDGDLPTRLQRLHSHWLDRDSGAVALRPIRVDAGRDIAFVVALGGGGGGDCGGGCGDIVARVPRHLGGAPVAQLAALARSGDTQLPSSLVLWDGAPPCEALERLEPRDLMHWFRDVTPRAGGGDAAAPQPARFVVELPRLRLEFALSGGEMWSCDFADYKLARVQQLDTLTGFTQYLVMARL